MKRRTIHKQPSRRWVTALCIIIGLALGLATAVTVYVNGLLNRVQYASAEEVEAPIQVSVKPMEDDRLSEADDQLKKLQHGEVLSDEDVTNILLIGTDTREAGRQSNSDTMILFSYNRKTQSIILTSFMRDMYVTIPGVGNYKLNHANMVGGPELLMETIEQNFKVRIDEYVLVDFYSFAKVVDIIGGVEIEVTENERFYINYTVQQLNLAEGRPQNSGLLENAGRVNLTGPQAVGYSRIRVLGNADYQRTSRQRTVVEQIIKKMRSASIPEMLQVVEEVLPHVTTNIEKSTLLAYMTEAPVMLQCPIEQLRLPSDGIFTSMTIDSMDVLLPEYEQNIILLQNTIYEQNTLEGD